jgi:hypothetical protein
MFKLAEVFQNLSQKNVLAAVFCLPVQRAGVTQSFTTRVQLSPSRATHGDWARVMLHTVNNESELLSLAYRKKTMPISKVPRDSSRPLLVATVEDLWLFLATGVPMAFVASRGLDVLIDESYQVI